MRAWAFLFLLLSSCSSPSGLHSSLFQGLAPLPHRPQLDLIPVSALPAYSVRLPEKFTLANGIQIFLMADPLVPGIALQMRLGMGSWYDPESAAGLAELTMRTWRSGGTKELPAAALDRELAFLGASLEVEVEAMTTVLRLRGLKQDFPRLLGILEEMLFQPRFVTERMELERGIMLGRVARRDDDPGGVASRESRRAFYGRQDPRVRRTESAELQVLSLGQAEKFFASHIGSRQVQVQVLGNMAMADLEPLLEKSIGEWQEQQAAVQEFPTKAPRPSGVRLLLLPRTEASQTEIRILAGGVRRSHPDWPALRLGAAIFGSGGFSNRMMSRIRSELGLTYSVGADWVPGWTQEGLFFGWCGTKHEDAPLAVSEMLNILEEFLGEGVSEEELEAARSRVLHSEIFRTDSSSEALALAANLSFYDYPRNLLEQELVAFRSLTAEQVVAACQRHLSAKNMLVFLVGDPAQLQGHFPSPLEIWEPDLLATDPLVTPEQTLQMVQHLLSGHGGQALWSSVPDIRGSLLPDSEQAPSAIENQRAFLEACRVPEILRKLAQNKFSVHSVRSRQLICTDVEGESLHLALGEDGLLASWSNVRANCQFSDYQLVAGVLLPKQIQVTLLESEPIVFTLRWAIGTESSP